MAARPRIGITSAPILHEGRRSERVDRSYTEAVTGAGALPCALPVLGPADAEEVLSGLDGLVLSGGGDVAPSLYGEAPAPEVYGVDASRDAWELALVAAARAARLPVLGICRGLQVVNVATGGTLIQHLPTFTDEPHREYERDREAVHPVEVGPASLLATVTGQPSFGVNSLHHQAVATVGGGLRAVAWAPDGVVEAVESSDDDNLLAVQWHPELLTPDPPHDRLFAWLVRAAVEPRVAVI